MESEISPGTVTEPAPKQQVPQPPPKHNSISAIAPWETPGPTEPDRNRREAGSTDSQSGRQSFQAPRKTSNAGAPIPSNWRNGTVMQSGSIFSSFYDDSSEEAAQRSPGLRPGSSQEDIYTGDRRPSVASATTISSIGSKSSVGRGFHKKLNTFFGDEFPGLEAVSRQNSESSLPPNALANAPGSSSSNNNGNLSLPRGRNNSTASTLQALNSQSSRSRPTSPSSLVARPRTPHASEVTPWEFQDDDEPPLPPPPNDKGAAPKNAKHHHHHHHRLHFPGHRHTKSKDDEKTTEPAPYLALRPSLSRGESVSSFRRNDLPLSSKPSSTNLTPSLTPRPPSPTPSAHSFIMNSKDAHHKRSLFDKFKRKEKDRGLDGLRDLPGSSASLHSTKFAKPGRTDNYQIAQKKRSFAADSLPLPRVVANNGKDSKGRLPFKTKTRENTLVARDPNDFLHGHPESNALWSLDTDFSDLSDIIAVRPRELGHPPQNDIFTGLESEEKNRQVLDPKPVEAGAWDAPDSWDVSKAGEENMARMRELDDDGNQLEVNTGPPYCLRVFRVDSTFAVLSVPLNTTVTDIIGLIRRKSFLNDDDDKYMITMKKHDLTRQLEKNERPLFIQRKLLQQAGYTESDKIEEVGRDDNSYLVRFTFLPLKKVGYASLADDPETEKLWGVTSFQHLDLSKKSLVTIPVTLHKRATEIISLNLSRNLSINVPKDFVQACANLKELKFIGNEAWKVPPSFSYATRLLHLDMSNNRLEQLEHAELNKLSGLAVLRFANNKLTSLPPYFGQYKVLRSLNISSNCLTSFPDSIIDITSLTDLDISFNLISNIPDVSRWTKLQKFLATNNKLTGSFPESTKNLTSLKEIDIRHNAIDNIDVFSTLPALEFLSCGYNSISTFQGYFQKVGSLEMNNNPITRFDFTQPVPSLWFLNLAKAKLAALPDDLFAKVINLKKLILDKNHFVSISPNVGKLVHLDHLSIAQNALSSLPPEIGRLSELRYLDLRENNLNTLPPQIWFARKLETLNLSSNVLGSFPKPGAPLPALPGDTPMPPEATVLEISESELGGLGDLQMRRPSQVSNGNYSSLGSASPGYQSRKGSVASTIQQNRKPSLMSRSSESTISAMTRKDSSLSNRLLTTFAGTMKQLYLADNRLQDEVFEELVLLQELRVLNVSYNILYDLPPRTLRRWPHLAEIYLSGNELRSLPAEDLEEITQLRVLHINGNKFQVLPAELAKVPKLAIMDVGSNLLKYNVSNWPYDWNWNWNPQLKYLNMSGNLRLEIKPGSTHKTGREDRDLTDFSSLTKLRVLGLMDVTLRSVVPDQNEDRRVRTAGSQIGPMSYGMADTLGKNEHLSTMDLVVERFRSHEDEYMFGMFDGQALSQGGSRIARYLYDNFKDRFMQELDRLRQPETAEDALRRTYLGLNKEIAIAVMHSTEYGRGDSRHPSRSVPSVPDLMEWDMTSGCVASVLFIKENELYVSNVGDATALLVDSDGGHKVITRKHDPTEPSERQRIKEAGGYVSRHGKLNDNLEVSRAFGYIKESPSVTAAPHTTQVTITENHELILIASHELWQYMSRDFAVDMARSERGDVSRAAQKLRDLAIAFGASGKIMVMVIGINDLQKRQRLQHRTPSMSVSPSGNVDELFPLSRRGRRDKNAPFDSRLARLDQEVEPPIGQVTLVFTDIKNSTLLWETYPNAMRSAIKMHNELMRRQLRIIGGYEVKTEGDAFMVSFPTVTSALLWCFTIQIQLLEVQWPPEILNSVHGEEVCDADGNIIFRGLSVRMGMHWGSPVCETDPVTKRMDYFGRMVNRSSRISSVADGGQITVSADFIAEIQRLLETSVDTDRSDSINSDEAVMLAGADSDNPFAAQIKRELRSLSSQGFEVKELGERRLKGLENPEYIYLMYPHALSSRLLVQQQRAEAAEQLQQNQLAARNAHGSTAGVAHLDEKGVALNVDNVWDLCAVALRLEGLCNTLESPVAQALKAPETALLERIREGGGEITDRFLWNIVEHQVSRVEVSVCL
jgi:adenylate cyclase